MGLLLHDNKPHNICTYISYVSPKQTKQDLCIHQETLEVVGDKGQWIKKVTKVKEIKQLTNGICTITYKQYQS